MPRIGTPLSPTATRVLLCGSGELGKEVVIELQRLGCEVIAVDRYANAPAMQVAHRSHVLSMLDGAALRAVIEAEGPNWRTTGIGSPRMARACRANCDRSWEIRVTRPVSCGRGETSLNHT